MPRNFRLFTAGDIPSPDLARFILTIHFLPSFRPELYLLGDTSSQIGTDMEDRARAELVEEYFSSTGVGAPEVEGFLWLKVN